MTKKEIREKFSAYLAQILDYLRVNQGVVNIDQDSYRHDFMTIFREAYRDGFCYIAYRRDRSAGGYAMCKSQRPTLNGDAIWDYALEHGWVHARMDGTERRYEQIRLVMTWCDESAYAWNSHRPSRRYEHKRRATARTGPR